MSEVQASHQCRGDLKLPGVFFSRNGKHGTQVRIDDVEEVLKLVRRYKENVPILQVVGVFSRQ